MAASRLAAIVLSALIGASALSASAAPRKLVVGIPPFDVAAVDGDSSAGQVLSKLIRIEMTKNIRLQPVLLTEVPAKPDPAADASAAGDAAAAAPDAAKSAGPAPNDVLLIGTVLAADASQNSQDVNTPSMFGGNLTIGGRVGRSTATVSLHIEIVDPKTGDTIDTFEVESKSSKTGVGADLQTAAGSYDSGDPSFDKSPMGEALRGAAAKVAAEMAKRADKLTPKS